MFKSFLLFDLILLLGLNALLWLWVLFLPIRVVRAPRLPMKAHGLALPGLVLLGPLGFRLSVLRHELVHQAQIRRWSPLGVALILSWHYGLWPVAQRLRTARWPGFWECHEACPLEQEAFRGMTDTRPLPRMWGEVPRLY